MIRITTYVVLINPIISQEFDTPSNLFRNPDGIFRGMCERSSIALDDILHARKAAVGDLERV